MRTQLHNWAPRNPQIVLCRLFSGIDNFAWGDTAARPIHGMAASDHGNEVHEHLLVSRLVVGWVLGFRPLPPWG